METFKITRNGVRFENFNYFLLASVFVLVIYYEYKKRKLSHVFGVKIPAVYGLPILGVSLRLVPTQKSLYAIESMFMKLKCRTFSTWIGIRPVIVTKDTEIVKVLLTSEDFLDKPMLLYSGIRRVLISGLVISTVNKWKKNRKLVNLSFHHRVLHSFIPVFNKGMRIAVAGFDALVDTGEQYVFEIIKNSIFLTTLENILGVAIKDDSKTDHKTIAAFESTLHKICLDVIFSSLGLGFLIRTPKFYKDFRHLRNFFKSIIAAKKATLKGVLGKNDDKTAEDNIKKRHGIFLDQACEFYQSGLFDNEDIINEAFTIITAGYDTSATTMYATLFLLAMHPDIQAKLYDEICEVMPNKMEQIEQEHLNKLSLMDMVIKETLRLVPPIPLLARQSPVDIQISRELFIPKGCTTIIPTFSLHRCLEIWGPDANEFNPYRFLPENLEKVPQFAFIPFSKGPRNCIGWRYASISLPIFLLGLLRHFKFSTSFKYEDLVFQEHMTMAIHKLPKLKIERRID